MAVGTHNRWSEGQLQYFFLERGWGLLIDSVHGALHDDAPDAVGFHRTRRNAVVRESASA